VAMELNNRYMCAVLMLYLFAEVMVKHQVRCFMKQNVYILLQDEVATVMKLQFVIVYVSARLLHYSLDSIV